MTSVDEDLTVIDEFCGAGGASLGLARAGFELKLGINHWDRAIDTHSANFPGAEHWCEDTSKLDMRRLPPARILWASPICTEASPAGGRKRRRKETHGQLELQEHGHVPKAAMIRTRTTFYDVLRSVEIRRFDAVLIENVVEVADDWELFGWWVEAMKRLDYNVQYVSVSAAHIGEEVNPHAPQWRDRLYLVFTRTGMRLPDVDPRPLAWCSECGRDTYAVQSWRRLHEGRKIGKYGQQYDYRCERAECRHALVEPYILPAAAAIDWSDLGTRIGDKPPKKCYGGLPLAPKTLRRIEVGRLMFGAPTTVEAAGNTYERPGSGYARVWPAEEAPLTALTTTRTKGVAVPDESAFLFAVNHGGDDPRAFRPGTAPLPARTAKLGDGLVVPFVTELRGGWSTARPIDHPLATMVASGRHHGLTVPDGAEDALFDEAFFIKNYGANARPKDMVKPVGGQPLGTVTVIDHHSLVIPYRRGAKPHRPGDRPLGTQLTNVQDGLAYLDNADLMACRFRMLQPRETLRAQRFPDDYIVVGNPSEQYKLAGNAVPANVAQWIGARLREVLDQGVAA